RTSWSVLSFLGRSWGGRSGRGVSRPDQTVTYVTSTCDRRSSNSADRRRLSRDSQSQRSKAVMSESMVNKNRWLALVIVCLGNLMIVLDVTIVGVALPSIRADLGFTESSRAWGATPYLLP